MKTNFSMKTNFIMKTLSFSLIVVIVCEFYLHKVNSYRILCGYAPISPSHYFVPEALMKGLAEKGHDVTVITSVPSKYSHPNFRQLTFQVPENLTEEFALLMKSGEGVIGLYKIIPKTLQLAKTVMEAFLNDPGVQKIMKEENFDLFITEAALEWALLGLGAHFNCPTVTVSSMSELNAVYKQIGNPLALSYAANPLFGFPTPLTFKYRVLNMFAFFFENLTYEPISYAMQKELYDKYFPSPKYPSFDDMIKNISLTMIAGHFSQGNIRPYVPSIIEIGGIQIKNKPDPLPGDLQKWMDDSTNGVIYMSFGSNIKSSTLPINLLNELSEVFSRLKVNVLWKFENGTLPGKPKNVRLEKWLPQDDILQHKNLKLFISHGGLGSVMEAQYHGVPLVLIPVFADQLSNADKAVREGLGVQFPFSELSGQLISKSINEVLTNSKYTNQAKYQSLLYHDRPNTALETGIFWTEYVIRHHGAKHLQSNAVHLNFFQLHSLDVIGFLALIVLILVYCVYKLMSFVARKLRNMYNKTKKD